MQNPILPPWLTPCDCLGLQELVQVVINDFPLEAQSQNRLLLFCTKSCGTCLSSGSQNLGCLAYLSGLPDFRVPCYGSVSDLWPETEPSPMDLTKAFHRKSENEP